MWQAQLSATTLNYIDLASHDDHLPIITLTVQITTMAKILVYSAAHSRHRAYIRNDTKL